MMCRGNFPTKFDKSTTSHIAYSYIGELLEKSRCQECCPAILVFQRLKPTRDFFEPTTWSNSVLHSRAYLA